MICVHFSTTFLVFGESRNAYIRVVTTLVIKGLNIEIDN